MRGYSPHEIVRQIRSRRISLAAGHGAADGEILVRGESVTPGYYGVPPEASSAFSEGWLHTGDIGRSTIPAA